MKSLIYRAAAQESVLGRARAGVTHAVTIFMYHEIGRDDDDIDAWQVVSQSDFCAQVAYLRKHYEIIDLDTAVDMMSSELRPHKPAAVLTFDDGLKGNHDYLFPLVKEMNLPVTIYVATEQVELQRAYWFDRVVNALDVRGSVSIDLSRWSLGSFDVRKTRGARRWAEIQAILMALKRISESDAMDAAEEIEQQVRACGFPRSSKPVLTPMTVDMVAEMAAHPLVTIGSHTHGHELLPSITPELARHTIQRSVEKLEAWTGERPRHFAYPSGRSDDDTRDLVAALGFASAVGTDSGLWTRDADVMNLPRISVGRYDSLDKFKVNALVGLRDVFRSTFF